MCWTTSRSPAPELYTDVSPQLRDVDIRPVPGVDGEMTVRRAWANMRDQEIDTLCVVDEGRNLKGLITVKDIATANMEVPDISILAESRTSYQNVVDTLDGTVLVGDIEGRYVEGSIRIGSGSAEHMERTITKGDPGHRGQPQRQPAGRHRDGRGLHRGVLGQQGVQGDLHAGRREGLHRHQHPPTIPMYPAR